MSASPFVFALIWTPAAFRSISCAAEATPASASVDATTTAASRPRITLIHIGRRAAPHAPSNRGTLQLANETDALARAARDARRPRRRVQGLRRLVLGAPELAAEPAAPRVPALQGAPDRLGARRLPLDRADRGARAARGLGLRRAGAQPVRQADLRRRARLRL